MGDDGKKLFLKSGDLRSVGASPIIKRFNSLLGIIAETDYVSGESLYTADDLELQLEKEFLKI
jgi:hypothetical protein